MRKLLLFFSLLCSTAMVAQSVSGKLVDSSNGDALIGASVAVCLHFRFKAAIRITLNTTQIRTTTDKTNTDGRSLRTSYLTSS